MVTKNELDVVFEEKQQHVIVCLCCCCCCCMSRLSVNGFSLARSLPRASVQALTQVDLSETAAPAPVPMGASKFLYRPATKEIRSHVERARLDYEPKV